jgi:molybdopterin synthase catalytic subunit
MTRLTHEPIDYHALTESVRSPHCGAVALFLGTVRDLTGEQVTVFLDYEAYAPMAEKKLAEIEADVRARWPVGNVAMVHRLGRLAVGDVSVAVAVSSPHRGDSFEACRYAIDTLKELVPIWKRENAPDGTGEWVHQSTMASRDPESSEGSASASPALPSADSGSRLNGTSPP